MSIKRIPESERGTSDHGWLKAKFSFSFANWYNPQKMGFGALRVLNNDRISGGAGFPTHYHQNMEIVTIPLRGAVAHKDSTGTDGIIKAGEVQIMSAGTGITHSEYNASKTEELELFQIWITPETIGLQPRYDQKDFDKTQKKNKWQVIVSPTPEKHEQSQEPIKIYQQAYFNLGDVEESKILEYKLNNPKHGVYLMIIEGEIEVDGQKFEKRDTAEIRNIKSFKIKANKDAKLLAIEVVL